MGVNFWTGSRLRHPFGDGHAEPTHAKRPRGRWPSRLPRLTAIADLLGEWSVMGLGRAALW